MNKHLYNKMLSVCILGKNCVSLLPDCVNHAAELTDEIFFVDLNSDDQSKLKASELGACIANLDSLIFVLQTEWVLFVKPEEKAVLRSYKDLCRILSNQSLNGYSVMTQRYIEPSALAGFQWVSSLEQYKNMKHYTYVPMLEIRLVRRPYADKCLNMLVQDVIPNDFHLESQAQDVIFLNSNHSKQVNISSDDDDHDLRCLKGDLTYEVRPHDALFELSKDYIQYSVLNKGFLNSFIEGAKFGFGGDKMYLSMINYLVQFGHFDDAKDFYETWCRNRSEKESLDILSTGGLIYSNLLLIDQGITCYQKAVQINQCADLFANLGKLYLLKGDRDKTLFYFKKAVDIKPDPLYYRIIEIVGKRDWKPSKLSLCMIARDEEEYILRCLKSIENIADEIIVVDTGSSDATVQIVKEFGGKVILASWNDDFSSMRNIGLKEATGDYILCMDADEFIEPRQRLPLSIFKAMLPPKKDLAFQVMVESEDKEEEMSVMLRVPSWNKILYHLRLFPNRPEIRFQGPAFEEVSKSLRELRIKTATDNIFKISHGIAKTKWRAERKIEAVKKSFENIHNPEYFFQGALLFLGLGELDQAYAWIKKSDLVDPRVAANIALLYLKEDNIEQARNIVKDSLTRWPESFDLFAVLAEVLFVEKQFDQVVNLLKNRIELFEDELGRKKASNALYYYGMSSIETGNLSEGVQSLSSAIEKDPLNKLYQMGAIYAFSKVEHWEDVINLSGQILQEEGKRLELLINDFSDVCTLLMELYKHVAGQERKEEAELCLKIIEYITHTKIPCNEDVEKISLI